MQTDKHGEAEVYQPGSKVWIKLHRRNDANRRFTRKIHLVYDGPYIVRNEVRRNAYVIENKNGNALETFNSMQLKPHIEAALNRRVEINMVKTSKEIRRIKIGEIQDFVLDMQQMSEKEKVQKGEVILTDEVQMLVQCRTEQTVHTMIQHQAEMGAGKT